MGKDTLKVIISTILLGIITNLISNKVQYNIDNEILIATEKFNDAREIKFVDMDFALKEHKWPVRVLGLLIIVFPWFISPLKLFLTEEVILHFFLKFIEKNPLAALSPKYAQKKFTSEVNSIYIPLSITYVIFYYLIIYKISNSYDVDILNYSLLTIEKILNFTLSYI